MFAKKKAAAVVAGLMLASSLTVAPAFANQVEQPTARDVITGIDEPVTRSTSDTSYSINFNGWYQRANTAWRAKDSSTSTYLHVVGTSSTAMKVYVDGATSSGGANSQNLTNGGFVWSPGPGQYEIHNMVHESGRRWARLGFSSDRGPSSLNGYWSPDCAGNYTDLNGLA